MKETGLSIKEMTLDSVTRSDSPSGSSEARERPPRGRPPQNYIWVVGEGYVHAQTGEAFDPIAHKAVLRARKTTLERRRYWDPTKSVRARRLLRTSTRKSRRQHV